MELHTSTLESCTQHCKPLDMSATGSKLTLEWRVDIHTKGYRLCPVLLTEPPQALQHPQLPLQDVYTYTLLGSADKSPACLYSPLCMLANTGGLLEWTFWLHQSCTACLNTAVAIGSVQTPTHTCNEAASTPDTPSMFADSVWCAVHSTLTPSPKTIWGEVWQMHCLECKHCTSGL